jgi:hypothetical protein
MKTDLPPFLPELYIQKENFKVKCSDCDFYVEDDGCCHFNAPICLGLIYKVHNDPFKAVWPGIIHPDVEFCGQFKRREIK